jgi:DinB superfamily
MPETPERLTERLLSEGMKTVDFFQALTSEQLDCPIYSDGSCWKIRQILAHFVSSEQAFGLLIRDVLSGGLGAPEAFDIDRFNESEVGKMVDLDSQTLLVKYENLRRSNAGLVSRMKPADLTRIGRHPYLGMASLEEIIKLLYRHNQIHQRDIRKLLAAQTG